MISKEMLGRYEYHNNLENSHKYWWLVYDKENRTYTAAYGRVGSHAQTTEYIGDTVALKKVKEKLKKGYKRLDGYKTTEGSNAVSFILSIPDEEAS